MIWIRNLGKRFQQTTIFESVDFYMKKGEIVSIVGPSGTGKSTFLKCLAGLEELSFGSFMINEEEMTSIPANKRPVVMMFQEPFLFPHMTVLENVMYGLQFQKGSKKQKRTKAKQFLDKVSLSLYEQHMPYELSGGQQQRVALARALVTNPSLLLLDEPFSSLDNSLRQEMRDWVRSLLQEQNITAIFVTHDLEEAMIMGDRVAIFGENKLQQIGDPLDVYLNPISLFVANFYSDGLLINQHTFVHTDKLKVILQGYQESYHQHWKGTVTNKRVKHGKIFYDIKIESFPKQVTILTDDHYKVGDVILVGVEKQKDLMILK